MNKIKYILNNTLNIIYLIKYNSNSSLTCGSLINVDGIRPSIHLHRF